MVFSPLHNEQLVNLYLWSSCICLYFLVVHMVKCGWRHEGKTVTLDHVAKACDVLIVYLSRIASKHSWGLSNKATCEWEVCALLWELLIEVIQPLHYTSVQQSNKNNTRRLKIKLFYAVTIIRLKVKEWWCCHKESFVLVWVDGMDHSVKGQLCISELHNYIIVFIKIFSLA